MSVSCSKMASCDELPGTLTAMKLFLEFLALFFSESAILTSETLMGL